MPDCEKVSTAVKGLDKIEEVGESAIKVFGEFEGERVEVTEGELEGVKAVDSVERVETAKGAEEAKVELEEVETVEGVEELEEIEEVD